MVRLISDFDGVIVDLSERYYQVYCASLARLSPANPAIQPLAKADFWELKRHHTPQQEVARRSGVGEAQLSEFIQYRHSHAHDLKNMVHDRVIDGSLEALQLAQDLGWEILTVTMRRTSELAEAFRLNPELEPLIPGDRRFCMPDAAERERDIDLKPILLDESLRKIPPAENTWMVGDTEADIRSAQAKNIPIISVLSGIRDRQILEDYKPDFIVANLWEAVQLIQSAQ